MSDPQLPVTLSAAKPPAGERRERISVLILTLNEERNIADCLRSLENLTDDVVILDSASTDRTVEMARAFPNTRVLQRQFDIEWRQRNFGLHECQWKHEWVYVCDADERTPGDLIDELLAIVNDATRAAVAYRLRYKNMFMGRWLKHGGIYPVWIMRLVRPGRVSYEIRETNVHPVVDGPIGEIQSHFLHYSFNNGLLPWLKKHNAYSQMESREAMRVFRGSAWGYLKGVFGRDRSARRRSLKNLGFYPPGRDLLRFMYMYFARSGFLDGRAGFNYAVMVSMYEYWIAVKIAEHRSHWRAKTDQLEVRLLAEDDHSRKAFHARRGSDVAQSNADGRPLVNVLIPTFNEAENIAAAVTNAKQLGPVFVLDSISNDGTQQLARAAGAIVIEHAFTDFASQKNWALDHLPFTADWVFILDADERITPRLREEVIERTSRPTRTNGYFVNRQLLFMGRVVQHGGLYPSWNLRLFRRGQARYEQRSVHEHMVCHGRTEYLHHLMLHVRRETMSQFIAKHIRYADDESVERLKWKLGDSQMASPGKLFRYQLRFRQWVRRSVWPRLPGRPLWRFLYMYFFRFGFLDGGPGLQMAKLMACYEYMIGLLYREKLARAWEPAHGVATSPDAPQSSPI